MANKVAFNLHNVHYAIMNETVTNGQVSYTYATPVPIPGAVTLNLNPSGEISPFYADGIVYYNATANNGYEGDLEIARVPDQMLIDVWGMLQDNNSKVITEVANAETKNVALLYQIDGDVTGQHYVLYKCALGRPGIGSSTTTGTKEPKTQSMSITASPRGDYKIKAHTVAETPAEIVQAWYASVHDGETAVATTEEPTEQPTEE